MKKLTFLFLSFVMAFSLNAQDGKKKLKEANKELATYKQNVAANGANLENAIKLLDEAFTDPLVSADPEALNVKGELYNSVIDANFVEGLKIQTTKMQCLKLLFWLLTHVKWRLLRQ